MNDKGYYNHPAISGNTVYFTSEDDLWSVPSAGGIARRLTSGLGWSSYPAASTDGSWLAFSASEEGVSEVHVISAKGGPARRLTYEGKICKPLFTRPSAYWDSLRTHWRCWGASLVSRSAQKTVVYSRKASQYNQVSPEPWGRLGRYGFLRIQLPLKFFQLFLEIGPALEAEEAMRLARIIDTVDALKHRPSRPRVKFRIFGKIACDDGRCVDN